MHSSTVREGPREGGFSLLETVLALYLMVTVCIFSAEMFRISLQAQATSRDSTLAVLVAERRSGEIEQWSRGRSSGAFNFNQAWPDKTTGHETPELIDGTDLLTGSVAPTSSAAPFALSADPDNPRFRTEARSWPYVLHTPARGWAGDVGMKSSMRLVRLEVNWGGGPDPDPSRQTSFLFLVPEPPRRIKRVSLTPAQATIKEAGGHEQFTAAAWDQDEHALEDVIFCWYCAPSVDDAGKAGRGTLVADPVDRTRAEVWSAVLRPDGWYSTGGRTIVRARGASDGMEAWGAAPVGLEASGSTTGPYEDPRAVKKP